MNRNIIPPPNSQRTDAPFEFTNKSGKKVVIRPNAQCKGNCTQDLLVSIGMEAGIEELANASNTTSIYAIIIGSILSRNDVEITKGMLFTNANHKNAIDDVLSGNPKTRNCRTFWRDIKRNPAIGLRRELLRINRPLMALGYPTGSSGHWIVLYYPGEKDGQKGFYGNDPYGTYPYTGELRLKTTVFYTEEFIIKNRFRSCIGIEGEILV